MFDIGWSELVVIGVVALIVIGPKELPSVLRTIGQSLGKVRRMAAEFQGQFNEAMREAEMADIKKSFDDISAASRDLDPTKLLAKLEEHAVERERSERKPDSAEVTPPAAEAPSASAVEASPAPVETPAAETPVVETPVVETPAAETPGPSAEAVPPAPSETEPVEAQASALMTQTKDAPPTAPDSKAS